MDIHGEQAENGNIFGGDFFLGEYEIRLLKGDGNAATVHCEFQLNNAAAIHSARRLAKGAVFEVWRGSERIYPAPIRKD